MMQNRKRVVHMTTVHHPYDPRIYYKQCLSLKKAGFDVTLIAQGDTNDQRVKSVNHIRLKKYQSRIKRMLFGVFSAYKEAKKLQADIYHFHDPELLIVGWLLKKKDNIVIYDIHEDYVTSILQKKYLPKVLRRFLASVYKLLEKWLTRKMELCLAEKYYQEIYPQGKCILNYPAYDQRLAHHQWDEQSVTSKLLYTGNVTEDRGALIHAALPLLDEHLSVYFVGKCSSDLAEKMYDVAEHKHEQIIIEGIDQFVKKERIEEMYMQHRWLAGIALFPPTEHYMRKELTKFFEYMVAGIPIICSNFPVWKAFIDRYQCGIAVDPYNKDEIREALHYLRTHPDQAKQMGENGKRSVLNELNWYAEAKKLIQWYNELMMSKHLS